MSMPGLFLSHGSPTLPLTDTPARSFLSEVSGTLARPKAILVISAHWETSVPTISAVDRNDTIHDFRGFPQPLYELRYPARRRSPRAAPTFCAHPGSIAGSIRAEASITAPGCRCC